MTGALLRFEWRYYTRQVSFLAAGLIFAGIGFALTATGFGPANVDINSPFSVTEGLGLASLASVFVIAVFCANAVVRDHEHQMAEIVFSTGVAKRDYLVARFFGSFLAAFTAFAATVLGMVAALAMPWQEASKIGRVTPLPYLWALLVIVLPGMLVAASTLFAVATLTRSVLASVVGAVGIYIFYFVAAAMTNSPLMAGSRPGATSSPLALLLDPFALAPFFDQTRLWTAAERNSRLVSLSGSLLLNRVVWLSYSALVLLFVYRSFAMRVVSSTRGVQAIEEPEATPRTTTWESVSAMTQRRGDLAKFAAATKLELRAVLGSVPFLLLTLLWGGLAVSEILSDITGGEYGSALYPITGVILGSIQQPLSIIAMVIIVYYSAEIVWRERSVGMMEIVNATPASNETFVLSKWIALSAMVLTLTFVGIAAALAVQLVRGYAVFDPSVIIAYLWVLAAPLILFSAAAILVQTLAPQKYAGMLLVFLLAVIVQGGASFGLAHPLWRFSAVPAVRYSAMNGLGPYLAGARWFMLLWTFVGGMLLATATIAWRRASSAVPLSPRALLRELTGGRRAFVAAFLFLSLATGAFIFYNTNILNTWSSPASRLDWAGSYEKKYSAMAHQPQPAIVGITADVAIFPAQRRYSAGGTFRLSNATSVPIDTILVSLPVDVQVSKLSVSRARLVGEDHRFGTWSFRFDPPLAPGAQAVLQFELSLSTKGFPAASPDTEVVENGSFVPSYRCFPTIGYRSGYEIDDPLERKKRGLPLRAEAGEEDIDLQTSWAKLDLTVSTDRDQTAIAPGQLDRTWIAGGRRYFQYRTEGAVHNTVIFASGRYAVAKAAAVSIPIALYYDPRHAQNVAKILDAARKAIELFSKSFGPYPQRDLKIVEVPVYERFGGFALPGVVFLNESRAFLIDARDPQRLDLVSRRTAHEVAHQWWGHFVSPPAVPGSSIIVESLTKYSELLLLEKMYGRDAVRKSLRTELDLYLTGRTAAEGREEPLVRAGSEPYLYYRKGAVVMNGIRDLLGDEIFNRALRSFASDEGGPLHHPTTAELMNHLDAVASPDQKSLIDDWMRKIVLYDLRLDSATAARRADGRFDVVLTVHCAKEILTGNKASTFAGGEAIDIGIFSDDPDRSVTGGSVLHLAKHGLRPGTNTIVITVAGNPLVASVDPFITRVDRNPLDNERRIDLK